MTQQHLHRKRILRVEHSKGETIDFVRVSRCNILPRQFLARIDAADLSWAGEWDNVKRDKDICYSGANGSDIGGST